MRKGVCVIRGEGVHGLVTLSQGSDGDPVKVTGKIEGLTPGQHGFHVHEHGDTTQGCASTGGHYNPFGKTHGAPADTERHVGDLGNITANAEGVAVVDIVDRQLSLTGQYSIVGRAFVVHEGTVLLLRVHNRTNLTCRLQASMTSARAATNCRRRPATPEVHATPLILLDLPRQRV